VPPINSPAAAAATLHAETPPTPPTGRAGGGAAAAAACRTHRRLVSFVRHQRAGMAVGLHRRQRLLLLLALRVGEHDGQPLLHLQLLPALRLGAPPQRDLPRLRRGLQRLVTQRCADASALPGCLRVFTDGTMHARVTTLTVTTTTSSSSPPSPAWLCITSLMMRRARNVLATAPQ
jgi:hypothetical protein